MQDIHRTRSNITAEDLDELVDIIGGERHEIANAPDDVHYVIKPPYLDSESRNIPAEIDWQASIPAEPEIKISSHGDTAGGVMHNASAPASYWRLRQIVDDGNLLTILELDPENNSRPSVAISVYGPPADADDIDAHLIDETDSS